MRTNSKEAQTEMTATTVLRRRPLELIAFDTIGPLHRTIDGSQYVLVPHHIDIKPTRAMAPSKIYSAHVANVIFDSRKVPYGIHAYAVANNRVKLRSKLHATLGTMICEKHLTTTAHHIQN